MNRAHRPGNPRRWQRQPTCGTGFDALDVAKIWLDYLPAGRIVTAERVNHVPLH
jgi:hypothetical protein